MTAALGLSYSEPKLFPKQIRFWPELPWVVLLSTAPWKLSSQVS